MRRVFLVVGFLLLSSIPAFGYAASFDCKKATSEAEKVICADPELSHFDDELGKAYKAALGHANEKQKQEIKDEQREWLKRRDASIQPDCPGCLAGQYRVRIRNLKAFLELWPGQDPPELKTEADKLKAMQRVFAQAVRDQPKSRLQLANHKFCRQLFEDMATGRTVTAIEPEAHIKAEDDPLLDRWRACHSAIEELPASALFPVYFSGTVPIRLYRTELDGNRENGEEDVLFNSPFRNGSGLSGHAGYTWMDLEKCEVRGAISLPDLIRFRAPPRGRRNLNLLASYQGQVIVVQQVAEYAPYISDEKVNYTMRVFSLASRFSELCNWHE
jgi:uncharacterized protein